ncbi:Endonuclease, Uma2 family (restriction endonuclease fold) [Hymenobacter daecheongensis DSM 21074]|uniref:Endonuclease, Uma2 family (Restriction endonuclease fold) n=1 Tax=Hymenobacter daecheongensis DSM 21074 TaxID=1121955 RepID=A0A1M6JU94_9BACT|nr:Uma2 family endonuclease [Hymenobacter daecheongensis]SHJ50180.1 Endonuclease, Uma2 family (restriction endonuclease fold) [Hymenobacter daecheongensis DSM 21074]
MKMHLELPDLTPLRLSGPHLAEMTDDEFFSFCQQHADLRIERTATHEILIMSPTGSRSGKRNARLNGQLYLWFSTHSHLGEVFDSNTGFTLPDGSVLSPDASWVSAAKWNALTAEQQDKFAPVCPEFVVELKSASDSTKTLQAKMLDWLRNGAQLAWLLVPETETAYLYRPGQPEPETVQGFDNELSGETVLPGLRLRLAELR